MTKSLIGANVLLLALLLGAVGYIVFPNLLPSQQPMSQSEPSGLTLSSPLPSPLPGTDAQSGSVGEISPSTQNLPQVDPSSAESKRVSSGSLSNSTFLPSANPALLASQGRPQFPQPQTEVKPSTYSSSGKTSQAAAAPSLAAQSQSLANPPLAEDEVKVPLAYQNPPAGLRWSDEQVAAKNELAKKFIEEVGENSNPEDEAYLKRWISAQQKSDDEFRTLYGWSAFSQFQRDQSSSYPSP